MAGIPPEGMSRDEAWHFDLAYFAEEARRLHADPNRAAFSGEFENAVRMLHEQIPLLNDEEVLLELMKLAALLGDGHTVIYGPSNETPVDFDTGTLPVKFYLFDDGLFIVEADSAWTNLIGSRVKQIGILNPENALERLKLLRGVDNEMTIKWLGVQFYLRRLNMLRGIGAVEGRLPGAVIP